MNKHIQKERTYMKHLKIENQKAFFTRGESWLVVTDMTKEDLLTKIGIHSLNFLRLIVAVEDTFGFEFDNDYLDLNQFSDVQSLITYIESNIEE